MWNKVQMEKEPAGDCKSKKIKNKVEGKLEHKPNIEKVIDI